MSDEPGKILLFYDVREKLIEFGQSDVAVRWNLNDFLHSFILPGKMDF